jgi:hypothetical protein
MKERIRINSIKLSGGKQPFSIYGAIAPKALISIVTIAINFDILSSSL